MKETQITSLVSWDVTSAPEVDKERRVGTSWTTAVHEDVDEDAEEELDGFLVLRICGDGGESICGDSGESIWGDSGERIWGDSGEGVDGDLAKCRANAVRMVASIVSGSPLKQKNKFKSRMW